MVALAKEWYPYNTTIVKLEDLVRRGLLHPLTDAMEWIVPGDKETPELSSGYIISFVAFHERGLAMPPHRFFQGLVHYYDIELQHLNPNDIQHIAMFMMLCEGFLAIEPDF